ncbi:MAG: hypothetical protein DRJ26_04705 [Candidatus Methanomethylicota archaeon]|uniref:C1q domain-containing protein n=1 Tax=Thermoproteota archaeon TaxID=2056631 RepID=A0A497F0M3_9CREN|nr:MAG: hypothetical protein DRJ26_04705 [Candidatus Verstraetearchaeota archaeon]
MAYGYITPHRIRLEDETSGTGYLIIQKDDELLWCDASANILQVLSCVKFGTLADRPVAGKKGRLYFTTDTKELFYDNGSAWVRVVSGETGIFDRDLDTYIDVEPSSDADKIVGYTAGTQVLNISSAGILTFFKQSGCSVYLSVDQTISAATTAKIQFDTVNFDIQNEYDTTNYRFTASESGIYIVATQVFFDVGAASDLLRIYIKVNGITQAKSAITTADANFHVLLLSHILQLSAGDYVEIYAANLSSDDIIKAGNENTKMAIVKVA